MKPITIEDIKEFIEKNEIALTSTHPKLCVPIVNRMCQKMLNGIKFDDIKICEDLIVDGHHRYLSSLIVAFEINSVPSNKTSATQPFNWTDVEYDKNDWDTVAKISYLNEQDAKYNDMDIEALRQIIAI